MVVKLNHTAAKYLKNINEHTQFQIISISHNQAYANTHLYFVTFLSNSTGIKPCLTKDFGSNFANVQLNNLHIGTLQ